jgi:hypothetical protein
MGCALPQITRSSPARIRVADEGEAASEDDVKAADKNKPGVKPPDPQQQKAGSQETKEALMNDCSTMPGGSSKPHH